MIDFGYVYRVPEHMIGAETAGGRLERGEIVCTKFGKLGGSHGLSELLCARTLHLYADWTGGEGVLVIWNGEPIERVRSLGSAVEAPQPIRWEMLIEREGIEP